MSGYSLYLIVIWRLFRIHLLNLKMEWEGGLPLIWHLRSRSLLSTSMLVLKYWVEKMKEAKMTRQAMPKIRRSHLQKKTTPLK